MGKAKALKVQKPENDFDDSLLIVHPNSENHKPNERKKVLIEEFAAEIARTAMPRRTAVKWAMERYGIAESTGNNYYAAAIRYLRPDDPQKYREELIDRNFAILEDMLQTALKKGDLKNANAVIRTLNQMVGIGGKTVEIKDSGPSGDTKTITISFA